MDFFFYMLAAVIFFFCIFSTVYNHLLQKKNKLKNLPPTPPSSLPILGHLHLLKKPLHRSLTALSTHYGPILYLRFGYRPVLVVSSSALAEDCLSRSDIIFANRPRLLAGKHLGFNYSGIGVASYGPHWRNLRRLATVEILCSHRVHELSAIRAEVVQSLLKGLFQDSEAGKSIAELKMRFSELAFNAMMGMIADKRYYGKNVIDSEEAKQFRKLVKETSALSGVTNLGDFLPVVKLIYFGGIVKRMMRLVKERDELLQGLINEKLRTKNKNDEFSSVGDERQGTKTKKKTLIEVLLSLQEKEPGYYRDSIIKGMLAALLGAGTDTSSLTMEWAMALLLNHPHVLEKAKAEVHMQVGGRLLEESDLSNLPYLRCIINETLRLRCIINETLRLHPITPLLLPHESSEETLVGGFTVPGNTMLLINAWAIHRDPKLWEDPDDFKPERFQGIDVAKEGCKFIPFGHGRRACPGAGLAMKLMGMALGSLIQCFEWERVGEEKVDMGEGPGLTIPKRLPLQAAYRPRKTMISILSHL